jgi:hypothetical protein
MSLPSPYFLIFELLVYAMFGLCLSHAMRRGSFTVAQLMAGVLFGLLLEWATIQQLQAYQYGRFLLMLGEVPLPIGVGWGSIIYAARLYSDATSLPAWARPVLDALLALNIDLAMDAVAIRLGFWDWAIGIREQWYGVPYANFWAWFWVVFFFSAGLRLLSRRLRGPARWLSPPGAIVIGVVGVLFTNRLIESTRSYPVYVGMVAVVVLGALLLVTLLRPRLHTRPKPALVAWVPALFHTYFLVAGIVSGVIFQPPVLLAVSLLMILVAALIHYQPPTRQAIRLLTRRQP